MKFYNIIHNNFTQFTFIPKYKYSLRTVNATLII